MGAGVALKAQQWGLGQSPDGKRLFWCILRSKIVSVGNTFGYYAALLPRRGPHIASHSVCLSVRPSVPCVPLWSITWRHLANYNDTLRAA